MATTTQAIFFCHGAPGGVGDVQLLNLTGSDGPVIAANVLGNGSDDVITGVIDAFDGQMGGH